MVAYSVTCGATSRQSVGYPQGPPNPWSSDFASDFGGGASVFYLALTVNKLLGVRGGPFGPEFGPEFGGPSMAVSTIAYKAPTVRAGASTSSQNAVTSIKHGVPAPLQTTTPSLASLYFPRLYHIVTAATNPEIARIPGQTYARSFGVNTPTNLFTLEFTSEFGVGPGGNVQNLQIGVGFVRQAPVFTQVAAVVRTTGKLLLAASAETVSFFKASGRLWSATNAAVQSRMLQTGKTASAGSASLSGIIRALPKRVSAIDAQGPRLAFGGNLFVRSLAAVSPEALSFARAVSALRSAASSQTPRALRTVGRIAGAIDASAAALVRAIMALRGVAAATVVASVRSVILLRPIASSGAVSSSRLTPHLVQNPTSEGQAAHNAPTLGHGEFSHVAAAQQVVLTISAKLSHLLPLGLVAGQSVAAVKGIWRSFFATSGAVQAGVRTTSKIIGLAFGSAYALLTVGFHAVSRAVVSGSAVFLRASRPILSTAQPQVSQVSAGTKKVTNFAPSAAMANLAGVVRTTAKRIGIGAAQFAAHIRGFITVTEHARQSQVSSSTASRAVYLVTVSRQKSFSFAWYHLYVPDWAYQQTVLLPPGGGPAEPAAFGPIDPADQTTFAFDWSSRAYPNDPIISASVVSSPPGMTFYGPVFTGGTLVEVTVMPFTPVALPATYLLRCTVNFASGRRSSFSIPVPVRTL